MLEKVTQCAISETELIDTCWDVNENNQLNNNQQNKELIDTCWDVNLGRTVTLRVDRKELIDTCWDVNVLSRKALNLYLRINRYMLGCK